MGWELPPIPGENPINGGNLKKVEEIVKKGVDRWGRMVYYKQAFRESGWPGQLNQV